MLLAVGKEDGEGEGAEDVGKGMYKKVLGEGAVHISCPLSLFFTCS